MRIVHIDRQRSWTGQINRSFNVAVGLREHGWDVALIGHPGSQLGERGRAAGFEVLTVPLRGWPIYPSILKIARFSREKPIDVLHAHGPRDHLAAALAGKLGKIGCVARTKHNHTRLRSGAFSRILFRGTPVVTVSEFVRRRLIEDGVDGAGIRTVHTSVDTQRFAPRDRDPKLREELGIGPDEIVIGNVSSLHKRKGIEEILRAFAILAKRPELKLILCGKNADPWRPLTKHLGLTDRVVFPGFQKDVPAYLAQLDVYVLPSREEGLGTSILEAMCLGLPVVVSNAGGIPESVVPGTGVVLEDTGPESIAAAVTALVDDPDRRRTLGEAAHERVVEAFTVENMVARMIAFYEEIAAGR